MDTNKFIMWTAVTIGGLLGAYLPVWLFGADPLGGWSILGSTVGGICGIWVWYKFLRS
ncbi:hypothetical protein H7Y40_03010 [Pedobacter sp.]|nr:hypothetical protein [Candidatus Saccharibacteria bacterium]